MSNFLPASESDRDFDISTSLRRLQSPQHRDLEINRLAAAVRDRLADLAGDVDAMLAGDVDAEAGMTNLAGRAQDLETLEEIKGQLFDTKSRAGLAKLADVAAFDRDAAHVIREWLVARLGECDKSKRTDALKRIFGAETTDAVKDAFALVFYMGRTDSQAAELLGQQLEDVRAQLKVMNDYLTPVARQADMPVPSGSAHPPVGRYASRSRWRTSLRVAAILATALVAGGFVLVLSLRGRDHHADPLPIEPRRPGEGKSVTVGTPSVTMSFCWIPPGEFEMGAGLSDASADRPRRVTISKGFWMGRTEVTQGEWQAVGVRMSGDKGPTIPSYNPTHAPTLPVAGVSQVNADQFCQEMGRLTGLPVRLPTEAEWEYACRAGTNTQYANGNGAAALGQIGWYSGNSVDRVHHVAQLPPNAWGLHDMHGNLAEWCADYYSPYDRLKSDLDPVQKFPEYRAFAVVRGGSFRGDAEACQASTRLKRARVEQIYFFGFRVCFSE